MAIVITIEDGTSVADANSFATVAQARQYAIERGVELAPETADGDNAVAVLLIKSMDYLRSLKYLGIRLSLNNPLPFPRSPWGEMIPDAVVEAQCRVALEVKNGIDVMPNVAAGTGAVVREKVGPIETQFSEKAGFYSIPKLPMVDALLRDFIVTGMPLTVVRV